MAARDITATAIAPTSTLAAVAVLAQPEATAVLLRLVVAAMARPLAFLARPLLTPAAVAAVQIKKRLVPVARAVVALVVTAQHRLLLMLLLGLPTQVAAVVVD